MASCLSAAILVFVALDGRARDPAIDTTGYHDRISAAAESLVPLRIGDWAGERLETPRPPSNCSIRTSCSTAATAT